MMSLNNFVLVLTRTRSTADCTFAQGAELAIIVGEMTTVKAGTGKHAVHVTSLRIIYKFESLKKDLINRVPWFVFQWIH